MKIIKKILLALSLVVVVSISLSMAQPTNAQSVADQIASLRTQIAMLQQQLNNLLNGSNQGQTFCYVFNRNLKVGDIGPEVSNLQTVLSKEGLYTINNTGIIATFDEKLASAVVAFQEKYASSTLTPNGLSHGTGYVGPSTRAELNMLYNCTVTSNSVPTAYNQNVTALTSTATSVTLTGSDSQGSSLTYSVVSYPVNGTLSGTAPNLVYTPNTNFTGSDSFTFKVNNGTYDSNNAVVSISINNYTTNNNYLSVNGISGATHLRVGQSGAWTVNVVSTSNSTLSYSVTWGDENMYPQPLSATGRMNIFMANQSLTLTHTYNTIGTYNVTVNITNNSGSNVSSSISVVVDNNY